jgi:serine/threonine-protein kinase
LLRLSEALASAEEAPDNLHAMGEGTPVERGDAPRTGRRLGEFLLERPLGRGGMGVVYLARKGPRGREIALKLLNPASELEDDRTRVRRFRREAKFMLALEHPNIIRAYEVGVVGRYHYLSMEFVPGESLKDMILRRGRVEPRAALKMMRQVADALCYGARRSVIHRDLKPENVLVRPDGVVKLADMGLAILANRKDLRLTATGMAMGTPLYMSPEQAQASRDIDTRSDIYSLGCTFYHAICGSPPFDGPNPFVIIEKHLKEDPGPPGRLVPGLDLRVESILLRCLEKKPERRFQSCAEVIAAIDRVLAPEGKGAPRRRRPRPAGALACPADEVPVCGSAALRVAAVILALVVLAMAGVLAWLILAKDLRLRLSGDGGAGRAVACGPSSLARPGGRARASLLDLL